MMASGPSRSNVGTPHGLMASREAGKVFFIRRRNSAATSFSAGFLRCTYESMIFTASAPLASREEDLGLAVFFAAVTFRFAGMAFFFAASVPNREFSARYAS